MQTTLPEPPASATKQQAFADMQAVLRGDRSSAEIAEWLPALHDRQPGTSGVSAEELAGFSAAMREAAIPLPLTDAERDALVDTCGTGGDGSGTFNISTAVALVAAACGVPVAKHGNRRVTARGGSADVREARGIPVQHTPESAADALRRHGFAFLLATRHHPAMARVAAVRRALPFRTVFNLLGPMTNPAGARRQVMGVYSAEAVTVVAEAMALSAASGGTVRQALVVHGHGGLDEISLSGRTQAAMVTSIGVEHFNIFPENAGVDTVSGSDLAALQGGDAVENAAILRAVFAGERGPRRDIVLLNSAAVLRVAGRAADLREGAGIAAAAIDSGDVQRKVRGLAGG